LKASDFALDRHDEKKLNNFISEVEEIEFQLEDLDEEEDKDEVLALRADLEKVLAEANEWRANRRLDMATEADAGTFDTREDAVMVDSMIAAWDAPWTCAADMCAVPTEP
jgi:hypothetical protein